VAIGFTGISYSNDGGLHWETLSDASFYTLRFANSTTAYAAGKGAMAKLVFY
ncbi:MAG: oxidoreductase, partial [Flavobacteriaceae bacterium]|nr:oxidoreductase [Flavobacteriaceae bacterium]